MGLIKRERVSGRGESSPSRDTPTRHEPPTRWCEGITRDGARCLMNDRLDIQAAQSLRAGSAFCWWHQPRPEGALPGGALGPLDQGVSAELAGSAPSGSGASFVTLKRCAVAFLVWTFLVWWAGRLRYPLCTQCAICWVLLFEKMYVPVAHVTAHVETNRIVTVVMLPWLFDLVVVMMADDRPTLKIFCIVI